MFFGVSHTKRSHIYQYKTFKNFIQRLVALSLYQELKTQHKEALLIHILQVFINSN